MDRVKILYRGESVRIQIEGEELLIIKENSEDELIMQIFDFLEKNINIKIEEG